MALEVVHRHETGAGIWRQIQAYGTDFWRRFLERVSEALRYTGLLIHTRSYTAVHWHNGQLLNASRKDERHYTQ